MPVHRDYRLVRRMVKHFVGPDEINTALGSIAAVSSDAPLPVRWERKVSEFVAHSSGLATTIVWLPDRIFTGEEDAVPNTLRVFGRQLKDQFQETWFLDYEDEEAISPHLDRQLPGRWVLTRFDWDDDTYMFQSLPQQRKTARAMGEKILPIGEATWTMLLLRMVTDKRLLDVVWRSGSMMQLYPLCVGKDDRKQGIEITHEAPVHQCSHFGLAAGVYL